MIGGRNRTNAAPLVADLLIGSLFFAVLACSGPGRRQEATTDPVFAGLRLRFQVGTGVRGESDLLGSPTGLAMLGDSLLVLDTALRGSSSLRVFGPGGTPAGNIGRVGEGPGEYRKPWAMAVSPKDGALYLREAGGGLIHVYDRSAAFQRTLHLRIGGLLASYELMLRADQAGSVYVLVYEYSVSRGPVTDFTPHPVFYVVGPDGAVGDTLRVPVEASDPWLLIAHGLPPRGTAIGRIPFAPGLVWSLGADGALVHGLSDRYEIYLARRDGTEGTLTREVPAVPVEDAEARWYRTEETYSLRVNREDWVWDGPEVPDTKPYFTAIFPDEAGRIWVMREGPGRPIEGCDPTPEDQDDLEAAPCWEHTWTFDVFDAASCAYLGSTDVPAGFQSFPIPYIADDTFVCAVLDDQGAPIVRVYDIIR